MPPEPDPEPEPPQDSGDYKPLPIIPAGSLTTRIQGAGVFIHLDNADLGISGTNDKDVIKDIDVVVTDTTSNKGISITLKEFNEYGEGDATVCLHVVLSDAHNDIKVDITGTINGKKYKGEAVFVEGVYESDFEPTAISLEPNETSVKPGAEIVFKVVSTAPYKKVDVTDKCTFVIEGTDSTGSKVDGNKFTAGNSDGTVTVKASYNDEVTATATIRIDANSLPTVLSESDIVGGGITVYVSKEIIGTAPSKDDVKITGTVLYNGVTTNLDSSATDGGIRVEVVEMQSDRLRLHFVKTVGYNAGDNVSESYIITWDNVVINVEFYQNALKSSSIKIEQ